MPQCMTPFGVKRKTNNQETIPVPCGKCPNCVTRRVSAWSFRLMEEDKISTSSLFITLTYDTKHIPITRAGFTSVNKRDVQLFFKRLRKLETGQKIKYFLAAEYGGRTKRPHYHIILFNASASNVDKAWELGSIHYGQVSGASVGYTLKYLSKPAWYPMHRNDDREPEFRLMSKRLGSNYITDKMIKWHIANIGERMYCTLPGGKKVSMPRYYKDKIYNEHQRKAAAFFTRIRMVEDEQKNPVPIMQKIASDEAAFRKMYYLSKKTDNL